MFTQKENIRPGVKGYIKYVNDIRIAQGSLGIFWLGQAGFIIKTAGGKRIAIDPYLSDFCERLVGFKRIMPSIMPTDEFDADYLFISHEHPDHFDDDLIEQLKEKNHLKIFGPRKCEEKAVELGINKARFSRLEEGKDVDFGEFLLVPVKADHGELSPEALGFIFDFGFVKVYFAGDTAYSPDQLKKAYEMKPEIALLPINGEYGNLNSEDAVKMAKGIGANVLIPCHYWTFVEHGSCPIELKKIMEKEMPEIKLAFLAQGEGYIYETHA